MKIPIDKSYIVYNSESLALVGVYSSIGEAMSRCSEYDGVINRTFSKNDDLIKRIDEVNESDIKIGNRKRKLILSQRSFEINKHTINTLEKANLQLSKSIAEGLKEFGGHLD